MARRSYLLGAYPDGAEVAGDRAQRRHPAQQPEHHRQPMFVEGAVQGGGNQCVLGLLGLLGDGQREFPAALYAGQLAGAGGARAQRSFAGVPGRMTGGVTAAHPTDRSVN
ncbi:hypothetical protein ACIBK8_22745 [Streptomyces sp. NPDC050161]|uniref:hypothetical protein n=1 Tax=Streptomyces sp. NPDC050161 TaxID=3365604 RepID=UPI0037A4828C